MYSNADRVLKFGPPLVMMYIWSKTFSDAMTWSTATRVVVRPSNGIVMRRICCHGPAPSIAAASYSSRGISCRPARYSTKLKPSVHHTVVIARDTMAHLGEPSQFGSARPNVVTVRLNRPSFGVYSHTQISATTADGRMYGRKNASRKNQRPLRTRSASNANTNPSTMSGGVVRMVNQM